MLVSVEAHRSPLGQLAWSLLHRREALDTSPVTSVHPTASPATCLLRAMCWDAAGVLRDGARIAIAGAINSGRRYQIGRHREFQLPVAFFFAITSFLKEYFERLIL